jgi:tRNA(Ile)-lysidine synthase
MHLFARALADFAAARALLCPTDTLLVALSGGADSCALLLAACEAGLPNKITAAHFHHGMRGADANADAAFCAQLCARLKIPLVIGLGSLENSNEAEARAARYEFLCEAATDLGANVIATAHTADDQAETLLFRVFRGTSIDGLAGIPEQRQLTPELRLIRPLLFARRTEILNYCAEKQITPRHDPTNDDPRYPRSKIRALLPELAQSYNPKLPEALNRLSQHAAIDADYLQAAAQALWTESFVPPQSSNYLTLRVLPLRTAHAALRQRVLQKALWTISRHSHREELATTRWVEKLEALLTQKKPLDLPGGWRATVEADQLWIWQKPARFNALLNVPGNLEIPEQQVIRATIGTPLAKTDRQRESLQIDLGIYPNQLRVRSAQPEDRMAPLGMAGKTRTVRAMLKNKALFDRTLLVIDEETTTILWIIGVAQAETTRVPDGATQVLLLEIEDSLGIEDSAG